MGCRWKRLCQGKLDLPVLTIFATRGRHKMGKTTPKGVFELSEPLLGPDIGLWGVVESVLARPNQIYFF